MDKSTLDSRFTLDASDLRLVAGGLNPQPEPPGRLREIIAATTLTALDPTMVLGGLNLQAFAPR